MAGEPETLTHTDVVVERLDAPVGLVWPILSDFGAIGRYVATAQVERVEGAGVGCVRIIPTPRGEVREQLVSLDEDGRRFSYRVLDGSPVNMRGYVSDVTLVAEGSNACRIEWRGAFETRSAKDAPAQRRGLEQFYRNAVEGLRRVVAPA